MISLQRNRSRSRRTGITRLCPGPVDSFALASLTALLSFPLISLTACSHEKEEEPTVTVQIVNAEQRTIQRIVRTEALLVPLQQSAIVPKISAPIKAFYVKRGSKVRKGQLLATLENRDLVAATEESKGAYDQAQAAYETTTAASLPEE